MPSGGPWSLICIEPGDGLARTAFPILAAVSAQSESDHRGAGFCSAALCSYSFDYKGNVDEA